MRQSLNTHYGMENEVMVPSFCPQVDHLNQYNSQLKSRNSGRGGVGERVNEVG